MAQLHTRKLHLNRDSNRICQGIDHAVFQYLHTKTDKLLYLFLSYFRMFAKGRFQLFLTIQSCWSLPVLSLPTFEKEPKFIKTVFRQLHIENNWCLLFLSRYKACINRNRCSRHLIFICYMFFISIIFIYIERKWNKFENLLTNHVNQLYNQDYTFDWFRKSNRTLGSKESWWRWKFSVKRSCEWPWREASAKSDE